MRTLRYIHRLSNLLRWQSRLAGSKVHTRAWLEGANCCPGLGSEALSAVARSLGFGWAAAVACGLWVSMGSSRMQSLAWLRAASLARGVRGAVVSNGGGCGDSQGFPGGASGKEPACQCRRHKSPRRCEFNSWVGKITGEGNNTPHQYSCLENSADRGTWWATVHEVAKSRTQLSCTHRENSS